MTEFQNVLRDELLGDTEVVTRPAVGILGVHRCTGTVEHSEVRTRRQGKNIGRSCPADGTRHPAAPPRPLPAPPNDLPSRRADLTATRAPPAPDTTQRSGEGHQG